MEKMTTTALALVFTKQEEIGAVQSTVAWAMAAMDLRLGWTAPVRAGMDGKVAIKTLRETFGYRLDDAGQPVLDKKDNRAKRSAVFNRLALVEKLVSYMAKATPAYVTELHVAAIAGDGERMAETVTAIGASFCALAGDDTLDALSFFLETGKAKPAKVEPVADAVAALIAGDTVADAAKAELTEEATGRPLNFGDVLSFLMANKATMTPGQIDAIAELMAGERLQRLHNELTAAHDAAHDAAELMAA